MLAKDKFLFKFYLAHKLIYKSMVTVTTYCRKPKLKIGTEQTLMLSSWAYGIKENCNDDTQSKKFANWVNDLSTKCFLIFYI